MPVLLWVKRAFVLAASASMRSSFPAGRDAGPTEAMIYLLWISLHLWQYQILSRIKKKIAPTHNIIDPP